MKRKIIALVMILPVVFLLTLFSIGRIASVVVDIPVSGISITTGNRDGFIEVDLARYAGEIVLEAEVLPLNAKNRGYSFKVEPVESKPLADIEIADDGALKIRSTGSAKITAVSAKNGFTDSVILDVFSSKALSMTPVIYDVLGNEVELDSTEDGYAVSLRGGKYVFGANLYPADFSDASVKWTTSDPRVIEIDSAGRATARLSGSAEVIAECAEGVNGPLSFKLDVEVTPPETLSGITIEGAEHNSLLFKSGADVVTMLLEKTVETSQGLLITGADAEYVEEYSLNPINPENTQFELTLRLAAGHPASMSLELSWGSDAEKSDLTLTFADFNFDVYTSYHTDAAAEIYQKSDSSVEYFIASDFSPDGLRFEWELSGENISAAATQDSRSCIVAAGAVGGGELTVRAFDGDRQVGVAVVKTIVVVKGVLGAEFVENASTYGLENLLAVGDTACVNGNYVSFKTPLTLRLRTDKGYEYYSGADFEFSASDSSVLTPVLSDGGIAVAVSDDGIASIKAEWKYSHAFGVDVSATIRLRAVEGGVVVSDYAALKQAAADGRKIVLGGDIMLGLGMSEQQLKNEMGRMPTEYDWQYYTNQGKARPEIGYVIEFKNDVFGNGFELNADPFTKGSQDAAGMPASGLFDGPLDFVAIASAAVKAQDNVVFLVRTNGVTLNNVVLKGCSDESLVNENGFDLGELNYVGTTLELAADCRLLNSRVGNGRTVVRVFGGKTPAGSSAVVTDPAQIDVASERVTVSIESCILTNAREFLLKTGSNRAILSRGSNAETFAQTLLYDASGKPYSVYDERNKTDEFFYDNYVLTDVTLKDSVLATSGLFSIGMETHFSGIMLSGYHFTNPANWSRLAATSLATALRLEGDVRLLDWKRLDLVDSSTLIEITADAQKFLSLDVGAMINKVYSTRPETYGDLVWLDNSGAPFVHGGIAFYGGGYNYSYVDTSLLSSEALASYRINLSVLAEGVENPDDPLYGQGTLLPLAAGSGDFMFLMYNAGSETGYLKQQQMIEDGSAYIIPVAEY